MKLKEEREAFEGYCTMMVWTYRLTAVVIVVVVTLTLLGVIK